MTRSRFVPDFSQGGGDVSGKLRWGPNFGTDEAHLFGAAGSIQPLSNIGIGPQLQVGDAVNFQVAITWLLSLFAAGAISMKVTLNFLYILTMGEAISIAALAVGGLQAGVGGAVSGSATPDFTDQVGAAITEPALALDGLAQVGGAPLGAASISALRLQAGDAISIAGLTGAGTLNVGDAISLAALVAAGVSQAGDAVSMPALRLGGLAQATGHFTAIYTLTYPLTGTFSPVIPTGATNLAVELWAGGGGGGTANVNGGGGGGGGAYQLANIASPVAGTATLVIGVGGAVATDGSSSTYTNGVDSVTALPGLKGANGAAGGQGAGGGLGSGTHKGGGGGGGGGVLANGGGGGGGAGSTGNGGNGLASGAPGGGGTTEGGSGGKGGSGSTAADPGGIPSGGGGGASALAGAKGGGNGRGRIAYTAP